MKRILAFAAIMITLIGLFYGCSCSRSIDAMSAEELLDLGEKYLLEMDYEQAIVCFSKVIEIEPMNTYAYMNMGEAYMKLKKHEEAINAYLDALDTGYLPIEDESYAHIGVGIAYVISGQYEQAEDYSSALMDEESLPYGAYDKEKAHLHSVGNVIRLLNLAVQNRFEEIVPPDPHWNWNNYFYGMDDLWNFVRSMGGEMYLTLNNGDGMEPKIIKAFDYFNYDSGSTDVNLISEYPKLYIGDYIDGAQTGKGVGISVCSEKNDNPYLHGGEYIYAGDFVGGTRSGQGIWFICNGDDICYEGTWEQNSPNGYGQVSSNVGSTDLPRTIYQGNFSDGLEDGEMVSIRPNDEYCTLPHPYEASMGKRNSEYVECSHVTPYSEWTGYGWSIGDITDPHFGVNLRYGVQPWGYVY